MALTPPPPAPPSAPDAPGDAPSRGNPTTFRALADAFVQWQVGFRTWLAGFTAWLATYRAWQATNVAELNDLAEDMGASQGVASEAALAAAASQAAVAYIYPGLYAAAPVARPNGAAIQPGDLYTATTGATYRYVSGVWSLATNPIPGTLASRDGAEDLQNKTSISIGSPKVANHSFVDMSSNPKFFNGETRFGTKFGWSNPPSGSGAGGAVTQLDSKTNAVTLNKATGIISTHNASLAAGAIARFTLNSTYIDSNDLVIVHRTSGGAAESYRVWCDSTTSGAAFICLQNITAGALAQSVDIKFGILESVNT